MLVGYGKNVREDIENITDIFYKELDAFKSSISSYYGLKEEKFNDFIKVVKASGSIEFIERDYLGCKAS